jgi:2-dehydro-3-deoxyphosphooctonate aldolase (KDO 8-P synthase)
VGIVSKEVCIGSFAAGGSNPPLFILGPCVMEGENETLELARSLSEIAAELNLNFIFKASYDKANRTSIQSYRGPGLTQGLKILSMVKKELNILVTSDVHSPQEAEIAAEVVDLIQIPAFLCRQTDLVLAAARTGRPLNIKKGQFMAPWDMRYVVEKAASLGNERILLTERGTFFGYNRLVVDMVSLPLMREIGYPVVFDGTHSVQLPGQGEGCTTGLRQYIPHLVRAAMAIGVDGIFLEVHPDPDQARCDGGNSLPLGEVKDLLIKLLEIRAVVHDH